MGAISENEHLVKRYVEAGLTNLDVARKMREQHHVEVMPNSIAKWKSRHGYERRAYGAMPWRLRPEHAHTYAAKMVRLHLREQRGGELSDNDEGRLDGFRDYTPEGAVWVYRPETGQGFFAMALDEVEGIFEYVDVHA